jgi:excisionase family DNA binding protein
MNTTEDTAMPEAKSPPATKLAYSVEEAMEVCSLGRSTLYRAIEDGKLVARKHKGRTLITAVDLAKFINGLPKRVV